jgi:hypothetical protein
MDNNKVITEIVDTGSDITGAVSGAILGGLIAGPVGVIAGGASGTLITKALKTIGNNIKQKILANREEVRIGAAYYYAIEQFQKNLNAGNEIISNILQTEIFGRNASEEVLEGIISTAQRSYEEKKIRFIGKLYANLSFIKHSDLALANFMIRISDELTFRQFCIIHVLINKEILKLEEKLEKNAAGNSIITRHDLCCEIRYLKDKGLITLPAYFKNMEDNSDLLLLKDLGISKIGEQFYNLLSLVEIEKLDILDLIENMNNSH